MRLLFFYSCYVLKMTNVKTFRIDNRLWDKLSLTMKISPYMDSDEIGILLFDENDGRVCIDLWSFFSVDNKDFFMVNIDNYFNAEYFISKYKLWTFIDHLNLRERKTPVYEMNLEILKKYDPEWVERYLKKNVFDKLRND